MKFEQYIKRREKNLKDRFISQLSYIKTYKIEIPFKELISGIKNLYYWLPIIWSDKDYGEFDTFKILQSKLKKQLKSLEKFSFNTEFKFLGFYFFRRHYDVIDEDLKYLKIAINLMDKIYLNNSLDKETYLRTYDDEWHEYHKTEMHFMPADSKVVDKIKNLETSINRQRQMDSILEDKDFIPVDFDDVTMDVVNSLNYKGNMLMESTVVEDNLDTYFSQNKLLYKKLSRNSKSRVNIAIDISKAKSEKAKNLLYKILNEKVDRWSI